MLKTLCLFADMLFAGVLLWATGTPWYMQLTLMVSILFLSWYKIFYRHKDYEE